MTESLASNPFGTLSQTINGTGTSSSSPSITSKTTTPRTRPNTSSESTTARVAFTTSDSIINNSNTATVNRLSGAAHIKPHSTTLVTTTTKPSLLFNPSKTPMTPATGHTAAMEIGMNMNSMNMGLSRHANKALDQDRKPKLPALTHERH